MVAGDHYDPDAGAASLRYGDRRFLARRVDDAHSADENQVVLQPLAGLRVFIGFQRPIGDRQSAQRFVRQTLHIGVRACTLRLVERGHVHANPDATAMPHQHVGGALGDEDTFALMLVVELDGRHHLSVGTERDLADAFEASLAPVPHAELALRHKKRSFCWIALDFPGSVFRLPQGGIAGQAATAQDDDLLGAKRSFRRYPVLDLQVAQRRIADAGNAAAARRRHDPLDRHLGPRQRAGLVRADDGGRAKGLDRRERLDDSVAFGHALDAKRQHERQDCRKTFRHGRHCQRYSQQQHGDDVGRAFVCRIPAAPWRPR